MCVFVLSALRSTRTVGEASYALEKCNASQTGTCLMGGQTREPLVLSPYLTLFFFIIHYHLFGINVH